MIFFSATDVGGARALVPVLAELEKGSVPFCLMDADVLSAESDPSHRRIPVSSLDSEQAFGEFLRRKHVRVLCFGTAVQKRLPVYHARWAAARGVSTVAVLDNWMNYRQRFELPDLATAFPDHCLVMDQVAYDEAVRDGVPPSILEVTGQPGLAALAEEALQQGRDHAQPGTPARLVFVSEPAAQDQGAHAGVQSYRGYTEMDVLRVVSQVMDLQGGDCELTIAPHPREDREALHTFCSGLFPPTVRWALSAYPRGRDAVLHADAVMGMTSILLYEAWLLGLPVISLQPGVRGRGVSHFHHREGFCCVTTTEHAQDALHGWMAQALASRQEERSVRSDLFLHRAAPALVARRLKKIAGDAPASR